MDTVKGPAQELSQSTATAHKSPPRNEGELICALIDSLASQFEFAMDRVEQVETDCRQLRQALGACPLISGNQYLERLLPLLRKKTGAMPSAVFSLLEESTASCADSWPLLEGMLLARDRILVLRALNLAAQHARTGLLAVDRRMMKFLAEQIECDDSPLADSQALRQIATMLRDCLPPAPEGLDPVLALYETEENPGVRLLAARLLDLEGRPASPQLAQRLLGPEPYAFLGSYLDYTRASHQDLLHLVLPRGAPLKVLASLRRAEQICGEPLLRKIIAELGWPHLNLGIEVTQCIGITVGGSFPLVVSPLEAPLFETSEEARRMFERFLIVAHGGLPAEDRKSSGDDLVARFRSYNLLHAEALVDILDVAPLTREKIRRVVGRMDQIVEDFIVLFRSYTSEITILPGIYQELKDRVVSELEKETSKLQISAELTRLVQMFQDPRSLGAVKTLHGLKRYLHQRGLQLGIRLVETGGATNRTVDLAVTSRRRVLRTMIKIRYVDFESETGGTVEASRIPYAVGLLAHAYARQLLHGQNKFPGARIFCYANEVHYYLSFANHPAFLRIDYSPPLQGGMIDLEYYGVSKYELSAHPNPNLDAIRVFFRNLEFDFQVENTRIHARYDKERALDLGTLCEKAEALLALTPYLMELDWVIGNLSLSVEARQKVAEAWAAKFASWGVLPLTQLLTADRLGILMAEETGPTGEHESSWSGLGPYRDRFTVPAPTEFFARLRTRLDELNLDLIRFDAEVRHRSFDQVDIEQGLLRPVREALTRGEIVATPEGLRRRPPELFRKEHEAEKFAELLDSGNELIHNSSVLAAMVAPLERSLRLETTGSINGYEVQRGRLALRGDDLTLYFLRDGIGSAHLALFVHGEALFSSRESPRDPWRSNASTSAAELATLLRRNNYVTPGTVDSFAFPRPGPEKIRESFQKGNGTRRPPPQPGEQIAIGLKASPGRTVGTTLFGTAARSPKDFIGAVMVAPFVRPEDSTFLYHSAGIVSTGGGVLSHAGLIATQFHKPALIISGHWQLEANGTTTLVFPVLEYREEIRETQGWQVAVRRDMKEREHCLREGDLVVLDADEGTLRVLGQSREALALHEGFHLFAEASHRLNHTTHPKEILILRGWRLRAIHQIEKLLVRLSDPVLAQHAVHELLLGRTFGGDPSGHGAKTQLLSLLLNNRDLGQIVREHLLHLAQELERRHRILWERAKRRIPTSTSTYELLAMRLELLHLRESLEDVAGSMQTCRLETLEWSPYEVPKIDEAVGRRLEERRWEFANAIRHRRQIPAEDPRIRHLLRQLERIDMVLGPPSKEEQVARGSDRIWIEQQDAKVLRRFEHRHILESEEGGLGLFPLIGWKAANLAEAQRLGGHGLVPPWFVITHHAFEEMLELPLASPLTGLDGVPAGASTLREAIHAIVARTDMEPGQKSACIRGLWKRVAIPQKMAEEVAGAYQKLDRETAGDAGSEQESSPPFVAIRSSAREEDAEIAARAGEFETFLFVRGENSLLEHLKQAWSGLWTERAIHNRAVLGTGAEQIGGGVIVQCMVRSRVSGVLQTINVAEGELREIVVNAGLGLGEGVVSGVVAADQIVIDKESDLEKGPLRFRYITADKREQVVFSKRAGQGTTRTESLYHQRLRPALEYVELSELVRTAAVLESAYGYPLDIEFGIEGTRLWILQVRPVATFLSALQETVEHYPLV